MSSHQASEQMLGYLYQIIYALYLLLKSDNPNLQISIEKFDDIAFSENDNPRKLIQLKHHKCKSGDLTNSSTDLWRTLNVWIETVTQSLDLLEETNFFIITTSQAPDNSAAFYLKYNSERNTNKAFDLLQETCTTSKNEKHKKYYQRFKETDKDVIKKLIDHVYIIDEEPHINNIEGKIINEIKYSCLPKFENEIFERLSGWWQKNMIDALCSEKPVYFTQSQVRSYIVSMSQEYSNDNLPIDVFDIDGLEMKDLCNSDKIFYKQLELICASSKRMKNSLSDYYRAFKQRANWVRDDLLYVNELEKYEARLIDEWNHAFTNMIEDLDEIPESSENDKIREGRNLLKQLENKDIRIRSKCEEAFVMRGSYHILANDLKVGWHADFEERLKYLLDQEREKDESLE